MITFTTKTNPSLSRAYAGECGCDLVSCIKIEASHALATWHEAGQLRHRTHGEPLAGTIVATIEGDHIHGGDGQWLVGWQWYTIPGSELSPRGFVRRIRVTDVNRLEAWTAP